MNFKENLVKPVLFMVFNRPEKTKQVWEQIRKAKPAKLYISADGPRSGKPDDLEKTLQVRELVSKVDWDCDAKYLFHEKNLGCSFAGKTAFDWVFSQEEEMIELEDDTLPSQSFFWFVQDVLEKYKHYENVGYITGQNFMGIESGNASYFFSHYGGSSGWATWKRIYQQWDYKLQELNSVIYNKEFKSNFDSSFEYRYWLRNFKNYYLYGGNTYDLQSLFLIFKNDLKNIIPNKNLITNIGFDYEGANYNGGGEKFANKPRIELNEIVHPKIVERDRAIDKKIFKYHFQVRSEFEYWLRWNFGPIYRKFFPTPKL
jgi:hypothetical protein